MSGTPFPPRPILLVDDDEHWLKSLAFTLEYSAGIDHILQCPDSRKALEVVRERRPCLVILDLNMPHLSGDELLEAIHREQPDLPIIVVSGMNLVETAVRCLKAGAFDYFVKTTESERLIAGIRNALTLQTLRQQIKDLKSQFLTEALAHPQAFSQIITGNRSMLDLFRYMEAISIGREPILITGESGVGKELFAQAVHRLSNPESPCVAVNVAGLDDHAFSDTLFGHVKGAFTGADRARPGMIEKAAGGTLFLDEIGDLCPASQVKLLRLLQEREFFPLGSDTPRRMNARLVCATNHDLFARQEAGLFRRDLFYRLQTHQIRIPPLRERREDIPLLVSLFMEQAAKEFGREISAPSPAVLDLLSTHDFPGNIRELRALIYDAVGTHPKGEVPLSYFRKALGRKTNQVSATPGLNTDAMLGFGPRLPTLAQADRILTEEALRRSRGNQTLAARLLGISQPALSKRLKRREKS